MARMKRHTVEKSGDWSEETPNMDSYRMGCCDCGLVHDIQFRAIKVSELKPDGTFLYETLDQKEYRVEIRVRRNNRSTAQVRRHRTPSNARDKPPHERLEKD